MIRSSTSSFPVRSAVAAALTLFLVGPAAATEVDFDHWFHDRTMRIDLFHTGHAGEEIRAVDRIVSDGPWAGSRTRLLDELNRGASFLQVFDAATNRLLYSRGFSHLFGEWATTTEAAAGVPRTFHESLRLPWPRRPVRLVVSNRDGENVFQPAWSTTVDPDSRFVNPAPPTPGGEVWSVFESGPPTEKVDLLFVGEGYAENERDDLRADAERLAEVLFSEEPFATRRDDFNLRVLFVPSPTSGVSRPRAGQFRRNPLGTTYNVLDSERYVLTLDNRALRDAASGIPYEFVEILVNEEQYGGGGIYGDHATASVGAGFAPYLLVHEFGHHFADLGDEYYTSPVAYATGAADHPEPWAPNVTALHDPENLKWGDLVADDTPVPTPWGKEEYDRTSLAFQERRAGLRAKKVAESEMDTFFTEVRDWSTDYLGSQEHSGKVGAFEGASYEATGLYRPEADCLMFTRDEVGFCRVCSRAIEDVIDLYSE